MNPEETEDDTVIVRSSNDLLKMVIMKRAVMPEYQAKNAKIMIIDSGNLNQGIDLRNEQQLLFQVLLLYQIEVFVAYRTDFHYVRSITETIPPELPHLKSVTFWSCANPGTLMITLLKFSPNLRILQEQGGLLKAIGMTHDGTRREVSNVTNEIRTCVGEGENYNVIEWNYQRLEDRLGNPYQPPFKTIEQFICYKTALKDLRRVKGEIDGYIERNRKGYAKCRMAIYQLFLIKKFGEGNPFKMIDKNVVLMIAKLLYRSIGSKVWCV